MSDEEKSPIILKQKEIDSTLRKQNFDEMQNLLHKAYIKGSVNMEIFKMAYDYLKDNLNATKEQKQLALNFIIEHLPPEVRKELYIDLQREKTPSKIEKVVREEKKDIYKHIMDKIEQDKKLLNTEIKILEKHLEMKGKKTEEKINALLSKYEKVREDILKNVDILYEKYENNTATEEDKKNIIMSVTLLNEVNLMLSSLKLEKTSDKVMKGPSTKDSLGFKFHLIGSQFENAVYRTFIDAQNSLDETVTSLENVCSDMEKVAKGFNSDEDILKFVSMYEKNYKSLWRNANYLIGSIDDLKNQEEVAEGAYVEVRNFASQAVLTVASFGASGFFSIGTAGSTSVGTKVTKLGLNYATGIGVNVYQKGSLSEEDAVIEGIATALTMGGIPSTASRILVKNTSKLIEIYMDETKTINIIEIEETPLKYPDREME